MIKEEDVRVPIPKGGRRIRSQDLEFKPVRFNNFKVQQIVTMLFLYSASVRRNWTKLIIRK